MNILSAEIKRLCFNYSLLHQAATGQAAIKNIHQSKVTSSQHFVNIAARVSQSSETNLTLPEDSSKITAFKTTKHGHFKLHKHRNEFNAELLYWTALGC